MVLETERLILREMDEQDFNALYQIFSDPETMRHYPKPFDQDKVRYWIQWNQENYRVFGFGLWAVVLKETGELIGDCGITMQNIDGKIKPEIGYHICRDHWRKGYASEAARRCRDWLFENTPFQMVFSYMKYTNVGSYSTAEANGMRFIEEYPNEVDTISKVYAISREDWKRLKGCL